MACALTQARLKACREFVGGVKNVYFLTYAQADAVALTYGGTNNEITVWPTAAAPLRYELAEGTASFVETLTASEEGNFHFEQNLSIKLFGLSAADRKELLLLAAAYLHIFVEDFNGNIVLAGLQSGCTASGGSQSIGQAKGDLNGYTLEFVGREKEPANFIDPYTSIAFDNIANLTPTLS